MKFIIALFAAGALASMPAEYEHADETSMAWAHPTGYGWGESSSSWEEHSWAPSTYESHSWGPSTYESHSWGPSTWEHSYTSWTTLAAPTTTPVAPSMPMKPTGSMMSMPSMPSGSMMSMPSMPSGSVMPSMASGSGMSPVYTKAPTYTPGTSAMATATMPAVSSPASGSAIPSYTGAANAVKVGFGGLAAAAVAVLAF